MAESAGNSLIGYPSTPCPLGISHVVPAIKSSVFGHVINPLLTTFARSKWLNIVLVLFRVFTDHIQPSWTHAWSITPIYWYSFVIYTIQTGTILSHQKSQTLKRRTYFCFFTNFLQMIYRRSGGSFDKRSGLSHPLFAGELKLHVLSKLRYVKFFVTKHFSFTLNSVVHTATINLEIWPYLTRSHKMNFINLSPPFR